MEITNLTPDGYRSAGGAVTLARFDVQVTEHLRLCNLGLQRRPDGKFRTVAPNAFGKRSVTMHPTFADQITKAALSELEASQPHDHNTAA